MRVTDKKCMYIKNAHACVCGSGVKNKVDETQKEKKTSKLFLRKNNNTKKHNKLNYFLR